MTDRACGSRDAPHAPAAGLRRVGLGPRAALWVMFASSPLSPRRKFTCHLCDRSFTEKWALNNHMKLHTGEKPFKCTWPTCHYSFLTASAMKDHYRTHTGVPVHLGPGRRGLSSSQPEGIQWISCLKGLRLW